MPRNLRSDYMNFAKLGTAAAHNLASSGVANATMAELAGDPGGLALHGDNAYGYAPLTGRIAARFGVDADCVVTAAGCSFANHLAFAALVEPGDEVLVETPTYELLISTLAYFQARIRRFERREDRRWALDPEAVAAAITPRTRLVVLTNLHNPTSAPASDETIAAIGAIAARGGALVLVDEVYRELLFRDGGARTSFRADGNIIVTSSLTKAYGLSGLRCGWCLAPAALASRMRRLNDLFASLPPHVAEQLGVVAFDRLDALRQRANAMIDRNRAAYAAILGGDERLEQAVFECGTTVFPRLRAGDGDRFLSLVMERFDTSVVPGRFFDRPDHVRIGLGGDPAMTLAGLERIAAALRVA